MKGVYCQVKQIDSWLEALLNDLLLEDTMYRHSVLFCNSHHYMMKMSYQSEWMNYSTSHEGLWVCRNVHVLAIAIPA